MQTGLHFRSFSMNLFIFIIKIFNLVFLQLSFFFFLNDFVGGFGVMEWILLTAFFIFANEKLFI